MFQIRVLVQDGGNPPLERTGLLVVNMLRNQNAPRLERSDYEATILETYDIGRSVLAVSARDDDEKVW